MLADASSASSTRVVAAPPPPPPPPPPAPPTGRHLTEAQVQVTAKQVLEVGSRTLWTDDYDERLDKFAETLAPLDSDSRARVFAEVMRQDSGAMHSWLQGRRVSSLTGEGRVSAAERTAVADAFAGAYQRGDVSLTSAQTFLGVNTQFAPALDKSGFDGARALMAGSTPALNGFREKFLRETFAQVQARADNGFPSYGMDAAFAITLASDAGQNTAIAQAYAGLSAQGQQAVARDVGESAIGYRNSGAEIAGLRDPLVTLTGAVKTAYPTSTSYGRQVQGKLAAGLTQSRETVVQNAATSIYRDIAQGAAMQNTATPQANADRLQRVQLAQDQAARVLAALPPNATAEQVHALVQQNRQAVVAPVFTQYLELRGDTARQLSGASLRNEIGLAMGLQPDRVPANAADEQALARGEWDFFGGQGAQAVRAVESQIVEAGGANASVAVLPVTVDAKEIGLVQVPLFRVESADGRTRFVDFNPATGEARRYDNFQDWRENNKLPPGSMTYAENGHLTAGPDGKPRLVTENTPGTPDTFWENWGQPVLDGAAMVGGVVLLGAAIVGTGGTALIVGGAVLGAYGAYRGGEVLVDRGTHGQTLNPLENAEARNAWINVGASVIGFAAAGTSLRAASAMGRAAGGMDDAARAMQLAGTARTMNVAAQYADTAAMVDTGYSLAANWDQLSPQQRLTALAQMAFWGGGMAASARQAGGVRNLYGVGDMSQAMQRTNAWLQSQVPSGDRVRQVFASVADNFRPPQGFEVRELVTPDGLRIKVLVEKHDHILQMQSQNTGNGNTTPTPRLPQLADGTTLPPNTNFELAAANSRFIDPQALAAFGDASRLPTVSGKKVTVSHGAQAGETKTIILHGEANQTVTKNGVTLTKDANGFPIFDSRFDTILPNHLLGNQDEASHFRYANERLGALLEANPALAQQMGLTQAQVDHLKRSPPSGDPPPGFTWHHHQDVGRMQLVSTVDHQAHVPHTGGMAIWGGGYKR